MLWVEKIGRERFSHSRVLDLLKREKKQKQKQRMLALIPNRKVQTCGKPSTVWDKTGEIKDNLTVCNLDKCFKRMEMSVKN